MIKLIDMENAVELSSGKVREWEPKYARPELIEKNELSVKNDLYASLFVILGLAGVKFSYQDQSNLYSSNRDDFIERKKISNIVVKKK